MTGNEIGGLANEWMDVAECNHLHMILLTMTLGNLHANIAPSTGISNLLVSITQLA